MVKDRNGYPNNRGKIRNGEVRNLEWFKKRVFELTNGEYSVIGNYINYDTRIKMRHNSERCDYREFYMTPHQFLGTKNRKGHRCEVCTKHKPTEKSQLKELKEKFLNTEFKIDSVDFKNDIVWITHSKCETVFSRKRKSFLKQDPDLMLCPHCDVKSKANLFVSQILIKKNIDFIQEFSFGKELPMQRFDFRINIDSEKFILLELDGIQHSEQIEFFDTKTKFIHRQELDQKKDEFTKNKNIPFFRFQLPKSVSKDFLENNLQPKIEEILDHYKLS